MNKFLFLTSFSIFLISCGKTAVAYSNTIIKPQLEIVAQLDSIFTSNEKTVEQIKIHREKIVSISEKALNEVRTLDDFKGNSEFKNSAQKYFSFIFTYYKNTENLDSILYKFNDENRIQSIDSLIFDNTQKKLNEYLDLENDLLNQQKTFAEEFDVDLMK